MSPVDLPLGSIFSIFNFASRKPKTFFLTLESMLLAQLKSLEETFISAAIFFQQCFLFSLVIKSVFFVC